MNAAIYADPTILCFGDIVAELTGLFMYCDKLAGKDSLQAFLYDFDQGAVDFDDCTGSYRIKIAYPDGRKLRFGDNAGIMRWYIREDGFYTSLKEAMSDNPIPDYASIAQFLYFGCIYGIGTILQGVRRSDPGIYYVVENNCVTEKSKNLKPLEDLENGGDTLEEQMARLARATVGCNGIACTITGGTDSRNILSHMLHEGMRPLLNITGAETDADVRIAQEIAEQLGMELLHTTDAIEDADWISEAIQAADGMTGVCGVYRLNKKARRLRKEGIVLECGGLAGELYKNDFIKFDWPFYRGKPNWKRFLTHVVMGYNFPEGLCGAMLRPFIRQLPEDLLQWLSSHKGRSKHSAYLSRGYEVIQGRAAALCAMNSRYYIQYTPLMERQVAAMFCRMDPHDLSDDAYPRKQVSHFCPEIKNIRSIRGMTFDTHVTAEESLHYKKSILRTKLALTFRRNKVRGRRDACFQTGLSSPQFHTALEHCKALGIIAQEVSGDVLPAPIADRIFALGTIL